MKFDQFEDDDSVEVSFSEEEAPTTLRSEQIPDGMTLSERFINVIE